jgi:hypothetical protein
MAAVGVARACYDKYAPTQVLPAPLRDDLDQLAGHFFAQDQFQTLFINRLVPWDELTGEPNAGHAAVADMILSEAAAAALTANFDTMIEQWAAQHKVSLLGALNGQEAVNFAGTSNPLLKFHGCMNRDRPATLWTTAQLGVAAVAQRIENCRAWMNLHLTGRDLLVVGFWTDWGYLNDVLACSFDGAAAPTIVVVDPKSTADLQAAAPALWATLSASPHFHHVQMYGEEALSEIRVAFSEVWTRKLLALGAPLFEGLKGAPCPPALLQAPALDVDSFYDLRRDAEGTPSTRAARTWEPVPASAQVGLAHLLLAAAGAARKGAWYETGGQTIRVVQGAGKGLTTVRDHFKEPPTAPPPDIVVCAGALDQGVPGAIVGRGSGASVVRPSPGGGAEWLTLEEASGRLGL